MGRPPLHNVTTHLNLPRDLLDRMDAIVGPKGRSKFVRDALRQLLDRVAPVPGRQPRQDIFETDGGHEPRLSASGTAAMIEVIRRDGFDQVMRTLGYTDPLAFLHMLLGYSELPDRTVTLVAQLLVQYRISE